MDIGNALRLAERQLCIKAAVFVYQIKAAAKVPCILPYEKQAEPLAVVL